jgi:hypothetical protein
MTASSPRGTFNKPARLPSPPGIGRDTVCRLLSFPRRSGGAQVIMADNLARPDLVGVPRPGRVRVCRQFRACPAAERCCCADDLAKSRVTLRDQETGYRNPVAGSSARPSSRGVASARAGDRGRCRRYSVLPVRAASIYSGPCALNTHSSAMHREAASPGAGAGTPAWRTAQRHPFGRAGGPRERVLPCPAG